MKIPHMTTARVTKWQVYVGWNELRGTRVYDFAHVLTYHNLVDAHTAIALGPGIMFSFPKAAYDTWVDGPHRKEYNVTIEAS